MTGAKKEARALTAISGTFDELCKLAEFERVEEKAEEVKEEVQRAETRTTLPPAVPVAHGKKMNLSYTINLNLPSTTDVEVFNAIFRSLKEHLLHD